MAKKPAAETQSPAIASPVLNVTHYERVSTVMVTIVIGLLLTVVVLGVAWMATLRPSDVGPPPLETLEFPGGEPDGELDSTLKVESPEEETPDPSIAEEFSEETEITEVFDVVVELSDNATEQLDQQFQTEVENTGKPGSKEGTGRPALGIGGGEGGVSRANRWFIRFAESITINEYAKQLDSFGIELGVLFPAKKQLIYLKNLSAASPQKTVVNTGRNEKRLYMNWQGGNLKKSDIKLFAKAGINAKGALILHFYPKKTETMLAQLEIEKAKRPVKEIRRTVFTVRGSANRYRFVVTRQTFFRRR